MSLMQLMVQLGLNASGYQTGLKQAKSAAHGFADDLKSQIGGKLAGVFGVAAIEETVRRTVELGSRIQDTANRLGISTDAVQQWDYALKQNGSSIEAATPFFEKLAISRKKALEGNNDAIDAFRRLGVSMEQLRTQRVEDIAATIAQAFEHGDPQALIADLKEIGGKGGGELVAAFVDGLSAKIKEAPLIPPEVIQQLDEVADKFDRLKAEMTAGVAPIISFFLSIGQGLKNLVEDVLSLPIGFISGIKQAWDDSGGLFDFWKRLWSQPPAEAMANFQRTIREQTERGFDAEDRQNANKNKKKPGPLGDEITNAKNKLSDQEKAEQDIDAKRAAELEKVRRIHEQIQEGHRKTVLEGMNAEEKKLAIAKDIAALRARIQQMKDYGGATDLEIAEEEKKLGAKEDDLTKAAESQAKNQLKSLYGQQASSAVDLGNFIGLGRDPQRDTLDRLDTIHEDLRMMIALTKSDLSPAGEGAFPV